MAEAMRGDGTVFQYKGSRFWWIQYYANGKRVRESSQSTDPKAAKRLLRTRLQEKDSGELLFGQNLAISSLYESLERDYLVNARKDSGNLKSRWAKHLLPFFEARHIGEITSDTIALYISRRQTEKASNATINRELAIVKRMYKLAIKSGRLKVGQQPYIEMLKERNVRKGFVRDEHYDALAKETANVGLWLRAMFEVAYTYGWRKSELLHLKVSQVDLAGGVIMLNPGETKNDLGRTAPMIDRIKELLAACVSGKGPDDYVFTRDKDRLGRRTKKAGRIVDFRDDWDRACKAAGVSGLLFHDLRRSGVRNMRRDGISEKVAMLISGHKTRSVFERYNIVDPQDLLDAGAKLREGAIQRDRMQSLPIQQSIELTLDRKPN